MKKVMFVMEDYNEMIFIETLLKKIGFDCMGVQNDTKIEDKVLTFSPALIIADGFGRKINGLLLSQKIKRSKGVPKMMLVMTPPEKIDEDDRQRLSIDGMIDRPIHPVHLLEDIARILGLDVKSIRQKLDKLGLFQDMAKDDLQIVKGKVKSVPSATVVQLKQTDLTLEKRLQKYERYLENLPVPEVDGVAHSQVIEQVREFRAREDDPEIREIDEERMTFVKALFRR